MFSTVLQSEYLLCEESLLKLTKRNFPGNSVVMGAGVEHGCLQHDIFLPGKCCDVSAD